MAARDTIADALLDFEESIVPYRDADARDSHRPAQLKRADAVLDALYKAGWLRDDPESKRHHIAKWDAELRAENERLSVSLRNMTDPPLILASDDACEVTDWFVSQARRAIGDQ